VSLTALEAFVERALGTAGVPPEDARRIRSVLVDCELAGNDHGVAVLPFYLRAYAQGALNPTPRVRVLVDEPVLTLLDGDRGHGVIGTTAAMEACIAKARVHGLAGAGVRNSGHFLAAAPYAAMAAAAGLIGFVASRGGAMMPPTGGLTPSLGLNPQGWGIPAGEHEPVVLDVAPSMIVGGKVRQAALEGRALPEGVLADAEGRLTTDPTTAGRLFLPLGWPHAEHKGYGLALVLEVLCGVLLGGPRAYGQFCWALDPARFLPPDEFRGRMDAFIAELKGGRRRPGVAEIFVPGERGQRRRAALRAQGEVPLTAATWRQLQEAAAETGIALPGAGATPR
jgi:LDH2 family malate/lactate/ureidoglycolate dehydrogenase